MSQLCCMQSTNILNGRVLTSISFYIVSNAFAVLFLSVPSCCQIVILNFLYRRFCMQQHSTIFFSYNAIVYRKIQTHLRITECLHSCCHNWCVPSWKPLRTGLEHTQINTIVLRMVLTIMFNINDINFKRCLSNIQKVKHLEGRHRL